jgi:predicted RNase H-like HicB family nuclease
MSVATIEGAPVEELTEEELAEARRYSLLVQWSPEDGKWIATAPELSGIATHGSSPAEAVEMGAEMVATALAGLRAWGEPVPAPRLFGQ